MKHYNTLSKSEVSKPSTISARQVATWCKTNLGKAVEIHQTGDVISWNDAKLSAFENQQLINFLASL